MWLLWRFMIIWWRNISRTWDRRHRVHHILKHLVLLLLLRWYRLPCCLKQLGVWCRDHWVEDTWKNEGECEIGVKIMWKSREKVWVKNKPCVPFLYFMTFFGLLWFYLVARSCAIFFRPFPWTRKLYLVLLTSQAYDAYVFIVRSSLSTQFQKSLNIKRWKMA